MSVVPVVIFDMSAINRLSKVQNWNGLVVAILHGLHSRVLATNLEVSATVRSEERRDLADEDQHRSFLVVVSELKLSTSVLMYDEFWNAMLAAA